MEIYVYTNGQEAAAEYQNLKNGNRKVAIAGADNYVRSVDATDPNNPTTQHIWPAGSGPYWVVLVADSEIES